ncbi:hypothetical protein IU459_37420, partial [Nocardia amamiensis]
MTDQKLNYADVSHVFDPEISELRDIYIVGTDADAWRALLTELASSEWESRLFEGQSAAADDVTVEKIFSVNASPDEETYSLRATVADAWLWCHFYDLEEIEFSFAAEAIDSAAKFDELTRFLKFL